ncbi:EutP/PduV family microcompartment system protein [Stomatohabitans albus]|uniref:EutP/PduV family microcompartment system protein n=1 Tax=Stomatohabitans albus TaxID=3110766 RepID=UPI00300D1EAA
MAAVLMVGSVGVGKTTLTQRLTDRDIEYVKTQATYREGDVFDTPGEYLDGPFHKQALQLTSAEADVILFLLAADALECRIPPGFSSFFMKPVIGVVTKKDMATEDEVERSITLLEQTGAHPILVISAMTGEGIEELSQLINAEGGTS